MFRWFPACCLSLASLLAAGCDIPAPADPAPQPIAAAPVSPAEPAAQAEPADPPSDPQPADEPPPAPKPKQKPAAAKPQQPIQASEFGPDVIKQIEEATQALEDSRKRQQELQEDLKHAVELGNEVARNPKRLIWLEAMSELQAPVQGVLSVTLLESQFHSDLAEGWYDKLSERARAGIAAADDRDSAAEEGWQLIMTLSCPQDEGADGDAIPSLMRQALAKLQAPESDKLLTHHTVTSVETKDGTATMILECLLKKSAAESLEPGAEAAKK